MRRAPTAARLVALFAAGVLVFDFPLLELWLGHPLRLFAGWALLVAALAWLMEAEAWDD